MLETITESHRIVVKCSACDFKESYIGDETGQYLKTGYPVNVQTYCLTAIINWYVGHAFSTGHRVEVDKIDTTHSKLVLNNLVKTV